MYRKVFKTGGIYEVYEYEKLNTKNGGVLDGDGEFRKENYAQRMRSRRNKIRRLICENFDSASKFVTLTFADTELFDITDVKQCNHQLKLFVKRIKYQYSDFKYVAVIEFQKRGAIHYHMICNLPYIKKAELQRIWGLGFVKINAIDKVDNVGAYVIKYMTIDMDDDRLQGEQGYLRSKTLREPQEYCNWKEPDKTEYLKIMKSLKGKSPTYGGEPFVSENTGKTTYSQYNTNRE